MGNISQAATSKAGKAGIVIAVMGAIAGFTPLLTELREWCVAINVCGGKSAPPVDENPPQVFRKYVPIYDTGFDCTLASKNHEKVICTHQLAARADVNLNRVFEDIEGKTPENERQQLRYLQGHWATKVRPSSCPDSDFVYMSDETHQEIGNCLADAADLRRTKLLEKFVASSE